MVWAEDRPQGPAGEDTDLVHFSPSHLSVIFSQQTGETLSKYLINYRIGKAKEALCCTSKKSSQIAEETGYRDPHYFSYMFKKVTGMTPTQYRESRTGDELRQRG
ncbi:MAG: helix-turn-helix domain-containing protein [Lachnospiraceae bacterium]|nr:helix-turn-helix domain-containing protein [Lachnospiraceae bacterium]